MRYTTLVIAHDDDVEPGSLVPPMSETRCNLVHHDTTDLPPVITKTDAKKLKRKAEGEDVE